MSREIFAAVLLVTIAAAVSTSYADPSARIRSTEPLAPIAHEISGGEFDFIVWDHDTFTSIGSRFGVAPRVLAAANGKKVDARLQPGDVVHIDNRHIVPIEQPDLIEVNLPERMLFHFEGGRLSGAYPVAIGQPGLKWRTPTGAFDVTEMQKDPTWRVPASILEEEEARGKDPVNEVDPGPDNPLGKFWIGLSFPVIGIHGTNHPGTVFSYRTHGCVRLHPDDIEALFNAVEVDDRGVIVYYPVMLARLDDGRVFLESDRDIYGRGAAGLDDLKALARSGGIGNLIDWDRAEGVLSDEEGIARDVTFKSDRAGEAPNSIAKTTSGTDRVATNSPR